MKLLAISDIHSFLNETLKALRESGELESEDSVVLVDGDVLDRGPDPIGTVDFLIELDKKGKLIFVRGNHEDLLEEALDGIEKGDVIRILGASHHVGNGTVDTIFKLADMTPSEAVNNPAELVRRIRESRFYKELLPKAVNYYETENYVFTHGWIPCIPEGFGIDRKYFYDPNWRNADKRHWRFARTLNGMELAAIHGVREPDKTVVVGHWHTSYGHAKISKICSEYGSDAIFDPFYHDGIIAIDASTATSGKVNCVVIEDSFKK